jgi:hypothetical protein
MKDHGVKPHTIDPYERQIGPHDPNLDNFIANWSRFKNKLTVFLGAGASVGARNADDIPLPAAIGLRDDLWRAFMCSQADRDKFESTTLGMMSLEHASALVEARAGRAELRDHIVTTFRTKLPLWHHAALPLLNPKAVFTVNYDELVEQGWRAHRGAAPKEFVLRHRPERHPAGKVPLFKPHGTLDLANEKIGEGGLVITMFDYYQMICDYQGMLEMFLSDLSQRCVLFIGYAFMDMDIGAEIHRLRQQNQDVPWYAVFPRGDADVRRMFEEKFGIRQINRTAHNFFADLDEAVDFIPTAWKVDRVPELQSAGVIQ